MFIPLMVIVCPDYNLNTGFAFQHLSQFFRSAIRTIRLGICQTGAQVNSIRFDFGKLDGHASLMSNLLSLHGDKALTCGKAQRLSCS